MKFVELFAGAGGLSIGLERAGFSCVGHAEIERNARAILRRHWPNIPLYGDVAALSGSVFPSCDLLSGGSPCQDLSVAGKRNGLVNGSRSSLFFHQARLWNECGAPYMLWENVAGALSSNDGRDFAIVLSTLVGTTLHVPGNGWLGCGVAAGPSSVAAWRMLDLRFFGAPQRRMRVFVLCARAGGCDPAKVLFGEFLPLDDKGSATRVDDIRDIGRLRSLPNGQGGKSGPVQLTGTERYLMPIECERCMGWPGGHTEIGVSEDGSIYALSDSARYRLCGNGVGAHHSEWIGRRLMGLNT